MAQVINGSKVVSGSEEVSLTLNDDVINSIARRLATTLVLANDTVQSVISRENLEAGFRYALEIVVSSDTGAKPVYDLVPTFFSDITLPLAAKYRGVTIHVEAVAPGKRPDSYPEFLDVLRSLNIPLGRVLKVDPDGTSKVLQTGYLVIEGAEHFVSTETDISIEELVVRSMISVSEAEEAKIRRIMGHMDNLYCSRDELVRNWACSLPVGKRG